jgi:hypothetical protein
MQRLTRSVGLILVLTAAGVFQAGCAGAGSEPAIDLSQLSTNQVALTVEGMT